MKVCEVKGAIQINDMVEVGKGLAWVYWKVNFFQI